MLCKLTTASYKSQVKSALQGFHTSGLPLFLNVTLFHVSRKSNRPPL